MRYVNSRDKIDIVCKIADSSIIMSNENMSNEKEFSDACKSGDITLVEYLIKKVNIQTINTGILWASENGQLKVVEYLVDMGADFRAHDNYAVRYASENGHLEVVMYLVKKGANFQVNDNWTIRLASQNGHLEVVKYLVEMGANFRAHYNSYQKVNSTGANLPSLIRPINQWRPIDQLTTFTSRQATLRDNLNRLPFPTSFNKKRLPRGSFPCLSLLGVSTFQVCFCQIQIPIKRDKQRLSPDRFNVNSNEFLISADAIVSDTGAQRSVQLMLR